MIDAVVAEGLRSVLRQGGSTPCAVAESLGMSDNWTYRVLNGQRGLLVPTLRELAAELE